MLSVYVLFNVVDAERKEEMEEPTKTTAAAEQQEQIEGQDADEAGV